MSPKSGREATLRAILILFIVIPITGCGLGQKSAPTSTPVPTLTLAPSSTPTLAPTNTPIPTATIEPSPTPIPLPKGISDIVSNASVEYQDNFNYSFVSPNGWSSCAGNEAVWSAENGHLAINAQANKYGAVFYYADQMIHPNEAVYFLYAYYGNRDFVTLGFDGYVNGIVCSKFKEHAGFLFGCNGRYAGLASYGAFPYKRRPEEWLFRGQLEIAGTKLVWRPDGL